MKKYNLKNLLEKIYDLLKQMEPLEDACDVVWEGPYFIPKSKEWHPSHFLVYNESLYCSLIIRWHTYSMTWEIGTNEIKYEIGWGSGDYYNNEYLWGRALDQIYKRFKNALKNPDRYNKHLAKYLPLSCRKGKILRKYTWEKKIKSVIPITKIRQLEELLERSSKLPALSQISLKDYLEVVEIAKDAVFKDSRKLPLVEKYKKRADMRHGGMLDLPMNDVSAFEKWYHSGRWAGSHPWEIVFGHPHGIMLAARHDKDGWKYALWVSSLHWYGPAAHMAIALGEKEIPFEFYHSEEVLDALKGIDLVEVGPFFDKISFEELEKERPDVLKYIQWDPIPQTTLVSLKQKERILAAEQKRRQ